jgi:uncharacterized cupredoxin-like copper-binding protein
MEPIMQRWILIPAVALVLTLGGCGSDDNGGGSSGSSSSGGGGETLALSADQGGALKFDKTELKAKAGKVTIDFDNPSSIEHGVGVEGNGVEAKSDIVTDSKTSVSADLKAGTYEFYCPVPGHKEAGMKGTLTVE